jgi:hypothetical protein
MIRTGALVLLVTAIAAAGPQSEATLSGRIIDSASRRPIAGASVSYNTSTVDSSVSTDETGSYLIRVDVVPLESVPLKVSKPGYASLAVDFNNAVQLKPGDAKTRDFELRPAARLMGRIVDRDTGDPVPGVSVKLARLVYEPGRDSLHEARASSDGSFSIADLDPGDYQLEVDPPVAGKIRFGEQKPAEPSYGPTWFPDATRRDIASPSSSRAEKTAASKCESGSGTSATSRVLSRFPMA